MKKRIVALVLTLLLLMQCMPVSGLAAGMQLVSNTVGETYYTVTFTDANGNAMGTQYVESGETPVVPDAPSKDKHVFKGWEPSVTEGVHKDTTYVPVFEAVKEYKVTIKYVKQTEDEHNGEEMSPSIVRTYLSGEEFSEKFVSPSFTSWVADKKVVAYTHEDLSEAEKEIVVTYKPANKKYITNHYFISLDGFPAVDESRTQVTEHSSVIGEIVQGEALLDIPEGFHFFKPGEQVVLKEDEEAVTEAYYDRDINTVMFDCLGGEPIEAMTGKYESKIVLPEPQRAGYAFMGWCTTPECTDETPLAANAEVQIGSATLTTYYAKWEAQMVPYTVVYMMEKENLGHGPSIENPKDFYATNIIIEREAFTGTEVTAMVSDIEYVDFTAGKMYGEKRYPNLKIAEYMGADTQIVKGDGSTILNVYFKRIEYTLAMNLQKGEDWTAGKHVPLWFKYHGSNTYQDYIVISGIKYGEDISKVWPSETTGTFWKKDAEGNFVSADFAGWYAGIGDQLVRSHRVKAEAYVFDKHNVGNATDKEWVCAIRDAVRWVYVNYWVPPVVIPKNAPNNDTGVAITESVGNYVNSGYSGKTLDDLGFWLHPRSYYPKLSWNVQTSPAEIEGFTVNYAAINEKYGAHLVVKGSNTAKYSPSKGDDNINIEETIDGEKRKSYIYQFLYTRNNYDLSFVPALGNFELSSQSVPFEAKLSWYKPAELVEGETTARDENGILNRFVGWYYDKDYVNKVDWTSDLMHCRGISLYAKWEPLKINIAFDLNYEGAPEPEIYSMTVGSFVKNEEGFDPYPTRENYEFMGWYTSKNAEDGNVFPVDQAIAESLDGKTIYASWKEGLTSYTVQYLDKTTGAVLHETKHVKDKQIGLTPTELFVNIPGLRPDKLEASITLVEDPAKNKIVFYYSEQEEAEYQVIHRYTDAEGKPVEIAEPVQKTTDERVAAYAGHKDIPAGYYPAVAAKSRVLTSNPENNKIYFDYLPYPTATYVVHHYYQTNTETQTEYTQYPEDAAVKEQSNPIRKGYSYIARRKIADGYRIEKIFVETQSRGTGSNLYLTTTEEQLGKEVHIHMYYVLKYEPELAIEKVSDAEGKLGLGDTINYTIRVTNTGNCVLKNVVVEDELVGLEETIAYMSIGASETFTASYVVTEADIRAGKVVNVAVADAADVIDPMDPQNPIDVEEVKDEVTDETAEINVKLEVEKNTISMPANEAEDETYLNPSLSVDKATVSAPKNAGGYVAGETIRYRIRVTNTGNVTLRDVDVNDPLTGASWNIRALAVGASREYNTSYVVREADVAAGSVRNVVTADADPITDPKNPAIVYRPEDSDDVRDSVIPSYELTIRYWYEEVGGEKAATDFVKVYPTGSGYNVVSPKIPGYEVDIERVTGVITEDVVYNVIYKPVEYQLTVKYIYANGETAFPTHSEQLKYGDEYHVISPELEGYVVSREVVSGVMPGRDVEYTVIYIGVGPDGGNGNGRGTGGAIIIDEYGVPLGLGDVEVNVGDCFE